MDNVLCPACANENANNAFEAYRPYACGVNWDDKNLYCDECSVNIEYAYDENEME